MVLTGSPNVLNGDWTTVGAVGPVGVNELPLNAAVEIEMTVLIK